MFGRSIGITTHALLFESICLLMLLVEVLPNTDAFCEVRSRPRDGTNNQLSDSELEIDTRNASNPRKEARWINRVLTAIRSQSTVGTEGVVKPRKHLG